MVSGSLATAVAAVSCDRIHSRSASTSAFRIVSSDEPRSPSTRDSTADRKNHPPTANINPATIGQTQMDLRSQMLLAVTERIMLRAPELTALAALDVDFSFCESMLEPIY